VYGKIFDSIYEGTLYGQWEALVTFQQLIVLCDADGIVDMTPPAIAARTSIPLDIITKGLATLEAPDPYSRTPDQGGCRIELIDAHRPWGWHIVNHDKYQHMQDSDTIRDQTRERVKRHREQKRLETEGNAQVTAVTDGNAQKRHTNTDTNKRKALSGKPDLAPLNGHSVEIGILTYLNEKAGRDYKPVPANITLLTARLKEGATPEDLRAVVDRKCAQWLGDEKMAQYLRPATLFNAAKFASYQGEMDMPVQKRGLAI
jgi:uncharacterized phage protein (TIGR02220 family)